MYNTIPHIENLIVANIDGDYQPKLTNKSGLSGNPVYEISDGSIIKGYVKIFYNREKYLCMLNSFTILFLKRCGCSLP